MKASRYLFAALLALGLLAAGLISTSGAVAATSSKASLDTRVAPQLVVHAQSTIVDKATGRCLDSNAKGQVYTNPCKKGNNYQQWLRIRYTLEDKATGRCLDGNANRQVYTNPCSVGAQTGNGDTTNWYQEWPNAGNTLTDEGATAKAQQALYLDSNHLGQVYTNPPYDNANQFWIGAAVNAD